MTAPEVGTVDGLIGTLGLPAGCRVDQRIPKKLLMENGAPTAADKRLINDGIEEIQWIAALKPNTVGVVAYRDDQREYLEIALLALMLRDVGVKPVRAARLAELVHRAIPYPVLLLMQTGQGLAISLAHKRWAQNEAGKVVLDSDPVAVVLPGDAHSAVTLAAFTQALALTSRPHGTLFDLYQHWINSLDALLAAKSTGEFKSVDSPGQAAARRRALQDCERLEREAARLRAQAAKERQLARQVDLNLDLRRLQSQLLRLKESL